MLAGERTRAGAARPSRRSRSRRARRRCRPSSRPIDLEIRQQQQQQQQQADGRRAEPHRRVAVLDRALRRAGRGHQPHPRRPPRACCSTTRGRPRTSSARRCCRRWATSRRRAGRRDRGARRAGLGHRPRPASVLGALGAARENAPAQPRGRRRPSCGRASTSPGSRRRGPAAAPTRTPFLTWVRERSAAFNGTADAHAVARRGVALPRARPQHRAGRHDRPAGRRPRAGRRRRPVLGDAAAELRRLPGVPAQRAAARSTSAARSSSCCSTRCSRAR